MRISDIRYVLTISECGSFSKAAQILHISQPALSQCIQRLEMEIGCELFIREKKHIYLTMGGELFVQEGKKILSINDKLLESISRGKTVKSGAIILSASSAYSKYYFPKVFSEFTKYHPDIELHLIEAQNSAKRLQLLRDREIDFAIVKYNEHARDLRQLKLFQERILFAATNNILEQKHVKIYEKNNQIFINLKEFANEKFLGYSKNNTMYEAVSNICAEAGFIPNIIFRTDDPEIVRALITCGMGVGFLSSLYRFHYPEEDNLRYFNIDSQYDYRDYGLAWRMDVNLTQTSCEFIETLQKIHSNSHDNSSTI